MGIKDLIVTPILLVIVYLILYLIRPAVTDRNTRIYFFPAVTLKVVGAIALGLIYQYYYEAGGDTFAFHTHGSRYIYEAFWDSPSKAFDLIFADGVHKPETYYYSSRIWYFKDASTYHLVRLAGLFDIITFGTYSATAVLFALLSFSGLWAFFWMCYKNYPRLRLYLAIAILGVPSVFFWGSGIMKDTLTLTALMWATFAFYKIFFERRSWILWMIVFAVVALIIYSVKKYVLLSFLPACLIWLLSRYFLQIKSRITRSVVFPFVVILIIGLGYYTVLKVGEGDRRYSIDRLGETIRVTAYDIGFWTGKDAGSGYNLGELDGTLGSAVELAPAAINVALFRPYLWEVNSPLMLLSSLESMIIMLMTLYILFLLFTNSGARSGISRSIVLFCLAFAVVFAAAVGVTSYNFGTLSRYRIPLIPYYLTGLVLIWYYAKSSIKKSELASTE